MMRSRTTSHFVALLVLQLLGYFCIQVKALDMLNENAECVQAVIDIYTDVNWAGVGNGDYYATACQNPLLLVSAYAATTVYCKPEDFGPGFDIIEGWCTKYGDTVLRPPSEFAANLTPSAIAALPVYAQAEFNESALVTAPFLMDQAWFDLALVSEHNYDYQNRMHVYFSMSLYAFWGSLLLFGTVQNIVRKVLLKRRGYTYADAESSIRSPPTPSLLKPFVKLSSWGRKHIFTPSVMPPYHQVRILGCSIPTRAEGIVVVVYWIYNFLVSAVAYHGNANNIFWPKTSTQIWTYIAHRTGELSYANIPIMWMFSGRNNVFLWLTGWSFGSFNMFHRHVARISTLQGIMHSIAFTCYYFTGGYGASYRAEYAYLWFALGVAATVIMSFIILFSFSYFRTKLYEHFLIVHIVLSVLLLVFLYYHTKIYAASDYNYPYLLPAMIIWGLDRFLRLVRQVFCNIHVSRNKGKGLLKTKATATYHEGANLLTIDAVPANSKVFAGPGQHYYLYQPFRFFGWENHPFTLASWSQATPTDDLHLQFLVRPLNGWTKKLRQECQAKGNGSGPIPVTLLLEGPYGHAEPLHCFDHVLLIAGGSGIAGVLPYLLDHLRRTENAAGQPNKDGRIPTRTRSITLVWSDRREDYIRYIANSTLAACFGRDDIKMTFHLTSSLPANSSTASSSTEEVHTHQIAEKTDIPGADEKAVFSGEAGSTGSGAVTPPKKSSAAQIHIQSGRPNAASIITDMAASIHGTDSSLAVMVCGPASLSDDARYTVSKAMESKTDSIEYFEENFGW